MENVPDAKWQQLRAFQKSEAKRVTFLATKVDQEGSKRESLNEKLKEVLKAQADAIINLQTARWSQASRIEDLEKSFQEQRETIIRLERKVNQVARTEARRQSKIDATTKLMDTPIH